MYLPFLSSLCTNEPVETSNSVFHFSCTETVGRLNDLIDDYLFLLSTTVGEMITVITVSMECKLTRKFDTYMTLCVYT